MPISHGWEQLTTLKVPFQTLFSLAQPNLRSHRGTKWCYFIELIIPHNSVDNVFRAMKQKLKEETCQQVWYKWLGSKQLLHRPLYIYTIEIGIPCHWLHPLCMAILKTAPSLTKRRQLQLRHYIKKLLVLHSLFLGDNQITRGYLHVHFCNLYLPLHAMSITCWCVKLEFWSLNPLRYYLCKHFVIDCWF